jgi:hypothetical protein
VQKFLEGAKDKHVYALHCADSSEHLHLAMQGQDANQVEEATRGSSTLAAFTTNSVGHVHLKGIDSNVQKVRAAAKPSSTSKSQPSTSKSASSATQAGKIATTTSSASITAKEKLASKANSFFGSTVKANEKKSKESKTVTEKKSVNVVKQKEHIVKETKKKTIVEEDWDDEDSDNDDDAGKTLPDKEKIKKRQISASAPQGTGGMHQSDVVLNENEADDSASDDDNDGDGDGKKKKKKKAKKARVAEEPKEKVVFKKYGAMDDFMEDAALREREKNSSEEGASAGEAPKKVKRKKLVEKVSICFVCHAIDLTVIILPVCALFCLLTTFLCNVDVR